MWFECQGCGVDLFLFFCLVVGCGECGEGEEIVVCVFEVVGFGGQVLIFIVFMCECGQIGWYWFVVVCLVQKVLVGDCILIVGFVSEQCGQQFCDFIVKYFVGVWVDCFEKIFEWC